MDDYGSDNDDMYEVDWDDDAEAQPMTLISSM